MVDSTTINPVPLALKPTYFWQRRRFWIWSFVLFIVAVIGFVAWLPTTRALVQFHRVGLGMTEQQVVELLGQPKARSEYTARPTYIGNGQQFWIVGELMFVVYFRDGRVSGKQLCTDLKIAHQFFPSLFNRNLL